MGLSGDVHSAASNTLCARQRSALGEAPLWFSIVRPRLTLVGSRKRGIGAHISHQRKLSRKVCAEPRNRGGLHTGPKSHVIFGRPQLEYLPLLVKRHHCCPGHVAMAEKMIAPLVPHECPEAEGVLFRMSSKTRRNASGLEIMPMPKLHGSW